MFFCAEWPAWEYKMEFYSIELSENPIICDCRDYDIISFNRSYQHLQWLVRPNVRCAAPPELLNEKVSATMLLTPVYACTCNIQRGPKIGAILDALTLPNINRFQNCFTIRIKKKIVIILSLNIQPHLKCVATLPCEMPNVLKETHVENKTISVTTHF